LSHNTIRIWATTGAFCIVEGHLKYIAFGHGFNSTFGAYGPQLFDLATDPNELTNLAETRPDVARELDAKLRAELASEFNALSPTGDYEEIDVHVKRQQQALYKKFFLDESALEVQWRRLLECEAILNAAAVKGAAAIEWALVERPDLEFVCGANREPIELSDGLGPIQKLKKLFRKAYTGFDNEDWQKVQKWVEEEPGSSSIAGEIEAMPSVEPLAAVDTDTADSGAPRLPLIRLPKRLVEQMGARCLDGSGGGFYYLPAASATNASKLVIAIEGGGECRTAADCNAWRGGSGPSSSRWPSYRSFPRFSELSSSPYLNPDFHDWAKLFLPYCSADMHSGQRTTREPKLGGYFFAGHTLIAASLHHLANAPGYREPFTVLVTGSSAGGIGALLHADFISRHFANATVKASPACGFFYAGVSRYITRSHALEPKTTPTADTFRSRPLSRCVCVCVCSLRDWSSNVSTPKQHLGFIPEWAPYIDEGCAKATGGDMAACTDAHLALPHIQTPLFLRENLFDTAKLANCALFSRYSLLPSPSLSRTATSHRSILSSLSLILSSQAASSRADLSPPSRPPTSNNGAAGCAHSSPPSLPAAAILPRAASSRHPASTTARISIGRLPLLLAAWRFVMQCTNGSFDRMQRAQSRRRALWMTAASCRAHSLLVVGALTYKPTRLPLYAKHGCVWTVRGSRRKRRNVRRAYAIMRWICVSMDARRGPLPCLNGGVMVGSLQRAITFAISIFLCQTRRLHCHPPPQLPPHLPPPQPPP